MTDTIDIIYSDTGTGGRSAARGDGTDAEAELALSKPSDTPIVADHALVPDAMRGRGARIVPLCPVVEGHAERKRDALADVIQW